MASSPNQPQVNNAQRTRALAHGAASVTAAPRSLFLAAGLGFLLFIVYGSLVPFDFHERSLDAAWHTFQRIPWLILGVDSRADWVANLVLYIPVGFCFTAALDGAAGRFRAASVAAGCAVFLFGASVAVAIEFTQIFFPPRTVSLNDIVAELFGTAAGVALWWTGGAKFSRLLGAVNLGGPLAIRAAVTVYVLGYVSLSLFPYDFLLSAAELEGKLRVGLYDALIVRAACGELLVCGVKLGAEVVAAAPAGFLMGLLLSRRGASSYVTALVAGCILGAVIEVGQFFIASGVSQGISVLTRGAGFVAGVAVQHVARRAQLEAVRGYLRPLVLVAVFPYLGFLAALSGWFSASWTNGAGALASLQGISFIPFYYHYYTTESAALQSLLRIAGAYLPVGIGCWLWRFGGNRNAQGDAWIPTIVAAVLALVVETGRLFVPEKRPDPTDILLAAFAAWFGYTVTAAVARWASAGAPEAGTGSPALRQQAHAQAAGSSRPVFRLWALLILLAISPLVLLHPFAGGLVLFLAAYGVFLWRYPRAALPAVLALLPILNFGPWTGWILVEEFDLLIAVTVAVRLLQPPPAGADSRSAVLWPLALLGASYAISACIGLLPFQTLEQSALMTYYGSLNSVRVAKGFLWALALLPMLREEMRDTGNLERRIAAGVLLGLSAVVAAALWQRAAMAGVLDFSIDYRIAATFPETHIGGGDVEAYLAMAIPFTVAWIVLRPSAVRIALGTALFALGSYALAVTFARAGYLAYAAALAVLAVAVALRSLRQRGKHVAGLIVAVGVILTGAAVVGPIASSSFMQSRLAASGTDGAFRARHWREAIDMMDPGPAAALFGMGLGSYPRMYLLKNAAGAVPATFTYLREGENRYLRLGSGESLYLDQRVSTLAGQTYTLSLDLRSPDPKAGVSVSLCEKTEQHAFQCQRQSFTLKSADEKWSRETIALDSGQVGDAPWLLRPPVVVSLANPHAGTRIDIDNVSLRDAAGRELVANGDFARGGARWFFTTDNHAQWHVFNLWVHVYFEQGWLGILTLAVAVAVALVRLSSATWRGDLFSAALLAALCAALVIGLFNSLLDSPRVATLFFLLLFMALMRPRDSAEFVRPQAKADAIQPRSHA